MSKRKIITFLLIGAILRFFYGLGNGIINERDAHFIYGLGLKFYITGDWPYFGPDVISSNSQIPGALQALWVAVPLWIYPIPESPYILLTLAVVGSLGFLAWYLTRLEFQVPAEVVWLWVLTMPWSIFLGSAVINPGYVMIYSIGFMVAFYEVIREKSIPPIFSWKTAYFLMGFTLISIFQIHLSWVLLLPLILLAGGWDYLRSKRLAPMISRMTFLLLGLFLGGITLYPTIIRYGLDFGGGTEKNIVFNLENYKSFFTTFFNIMYYSSYQVVSGLNHYAFDRDLKKYLTQWWSAPVIVIPFLFGFIQLGLYTLGLWRLAPIRDLRWARIRGVMLLVFLYTWLSFFFTDNGNRSHIYFLLFPLTVIYSVFVLEWAWTKRWFRRVYAIAFIFMLLSHVLIAVDARFFNPRPFLFHKMRGKISSAIEHRDHTLYGKTRYERYRDENPDKNIRPGY